MAHLCGDRAAGVLQLPGVRFPTIRLLQLQIHDVILQRRDLRILGGELIEDLRQHGGGVVGLALRGLQRAGELVAV